MKRILERSGEDIYEGHVNPDTIAFPYGPDIIRDKNGVWRVLEDNPGYIGGVGDLIQARKSLLSGVPAYQQLDIVDKPEDFYKNLMDRYKKLAGGNAVVMYQIPPYPDNEDLRMRQIYKSLGVEVLTPNSVKKIISRPDGLHITWVEKGKNVTKKIGYFVMNGEHHEMEGSFDGTLRMAAIKKAQAYLYESDISPAVRALLEAALKVDPATGTVDLKELLHAIGKSSYQNNLQLNGKKRIRNLIDHIQSGRVASNYSPGVDFIGDKEFNIYVEDIVRHYLKEEPILRNVHTERFAFKNADGQWALNEVLLKRVLKNPAKYVVKVVDGRGGDGIYVGPKTDAATWQNIQEKIRAAPDRYIVQEYTALSRLDELIVDHRMISAVLPHEVFVSDTPWGRGISASSGDGKVNLSAAGREVAIVVIRDCARIIKKAASQ